MEDILGIKKKGIYFLPCLTLLDNLLGDLSEEKDRLKMTSMVFWMNFIERRKEGTFVLSWLDSFIGPILGDLSEERAVLKVGVWDEFIERRKEDTLVFS